MELTFNVRRGDGRTKDATYQAYHVDVEPETSVFEALVKVREEQDGTLAFRGNCAVGFCGDCTMLVNGRQEVACLTTVSKALKDDAIKIDPIPYAPTVKDVMYDAKRFIWDKVNSFSPGVVFNGAGQGGAQQVTDDELRPVRRVMRCTMCGICDQGCTVIDVNLDFKGPAALTKVYRYVFDPRDGRAKERVVEAGETNGVWDCVHCWEASDHCPFDIDPTHRIMDLRDRSVRLGVKSGTGNRQAARHYNAFERSVENHGWLDERNVAIQSYGGLIKGGLKMMPTGLAALRRGKANLLPHPKRPGASAIKALFARYREVTRTER